MIKKSKAFTLVEIMIVLMIIGAILTFVLPGLYRNYFKSDIAFTKMKMSKVSSALLEYKGDMGHFPTKREGGLQALLYRPNTPGADKWDEPYLDSEEDLEDKWGNEFEVNIPPVKYKKFRFFEIISPGANPEDGKEIYTGA